MVKNSVADILKNHGYLRNSGSGIWQPIEPKLIGFSDGDEVEERLARNVAGVKDRSVDSTEWAELIVDWSSEYHFSRLRANLLKPIPIHAGQRVLELGAGCGAITRWLGELGAEVIAVEGSMQRAAIAAARCSDLPNVQVVVQDLHDIPIFEADWVTLIGVLEYSRIYHAGADPIFETLSAARNQLAPGGALVVAIENQLGLKYFAGCREEHLGTRFTGIKGLYPENGPVTFGRRELDDRLASVGFSARRFFLPWPDYKLPTAVVDALAVADPDFNMAALVGRCLARDGDYPPLRAFSETLVWSALERNGLIPDFTNSFLVVAADTEVSLAARTPDRSTLAWNYSVNRRPAFHVITQFVREAEGLRVRKEPVNAQSATESGRWKHSIEPVSEYIIGELLSLNMVRAAECEDEHAFFQAGLRWIDLLLDRSFLCDSSRPGAAGEWFIDGDAVDLNPGNIIVDHSGNLRCFDQEWLCTELMSLGWVVLRGLLVLAPHAIHGSLFRTRSVVDIARQFLAFRGLTLSDADVQRACEIEVEFQSWVQGSPPEVVRWNKQAFVGAGAGGLPNVFDFAQSLAGERESLQRELEKIRAITMKAQHDRLRAEVELQRASELFIDTTRRNEEELARSRQEAQQLWLHCEHQRKTLAKFESHPIFGLLLRARRRLRKMMRKREADEGGQAPATMAPGRRTIHLHGEMPERNSPHAVDFRTSRGEHALDHSLGASLSGKPLD
jgi:precorrin-6B methylase 2